MENRRAKTFDEADLQRRIERAVELFKQGFNCSQSVVAAFSDIYGYTQDDAFLFAASFGGGIGRMRQTCGAACGMFMLTGLDNGSADGSDREAKSHNYAVVQQLAARFEDKCGSLVCAELLGLKEKGKRIFPAKPHQSAVAVPQESPASSSLELSATAEARTEEYYRKRPCVEMVRTAARLYAEYLRDAYLVAHDSDKTKLP